MVRPIKHNPLSEKVMNRNKEEKKKAIQAKFVLWFSINKKSLFYLNHFFFPFFPAGYFSATCTFSTCTAVGV